MQGDSQARWGHTIWPVFAWQAAIAGPQPGGNAGIAQRALQRGAPRPSTPAAAAAAACPPTAGTMAALTAKLVGGGYERPDAEKELPIDINYAKVAEWLVRRAGACGWPREELAAGARAPTAQG